MHASSLVLKARGKVKKAAWSMWRAAGGLGDCFSFRQESLPIFDQLEEKQRSNLWTEGQSFSGRLKVSWSHLCQYFCLKRRLGQMLTCCWDWSRDSRYLMIWLLNFLAFSFCGCRETFHTSEHSDTCEHIPHGQTPVPRSGSLLCAPSRRLFQSLSRTVSPWPPTATEKRESQSGKKKKARYWTFYFV